MRLKIDIVKDLASLEAEWLAFQDRAHGTFYQTYHWCSAWQTHVGAGRGIQPAIVTGRDERGALVFLLPFAVNAHGGVRVLEWLAMAQSSYGYGLYAKEFLPQASAWFADSGWAMLRDLINIDAISLHDLPIKIYGYDHPLLSWFSLRGRNSAYAMELGPDFEQVYAAKRSAETRRGNRKRDAKLAQVGDIHFGLPKTKQDATALIETMFAQQRDRLAESGIHGVFGRQERQFIQALAETAPQNGLPILLPYHLTIDGKMEAMMLGGNYKGCYWALISSLGAGEARKYSPGDAALRRTIQACCERGLNRFDFSSGDTAYKLQWADEITPLYDVVRGKTLRGYAWALSKIVSLATKRIIKQTPVLWKLASAWRRLRATES